MNIGERFFCSKCMREIKEEGICPYCGYDPAKAREYPADSIYLEEGTLLHGGRYQLGDVRGRGGFGITYAAWDFVLKIPVAMKEYFPEGYSGRDIFVGDQVEIEEENFLYYQLGLQNFSREARILASLQNIKSVVRVYDSFEENNTSYIVMEFVHGITLAEYCRGREFSVKKLLELLRGTIDDIILVHNAGVLHRDISPDNLIVQKDNTVKLVDFGAALARKEDKNFFLNREFAAPEQYTADGEQADGRMFMGCLLRYIV